MWWREESGWERGPCVVEWCVKPKFCNIVGGGDGRGRESTEKNLKTREDKS